MDGTLTNICESFIENRDRIKSVFRWENSYIYPACASLYVDKRQQVDTEKMLNCRGLLRKHTSFFSGFRGISQLVLISMLALDADPEGRLRRTTDLYTTLRSYFSSSQYLPLVAMIFSGSVSTEEYSGFAQKTRHIYNLMKRTHPYLTTSEDIVYSSLMALSGSDANQLIPEAERCFVLLKKKFFSKNAVQSLSNVLAICEGTSEQKCQKVFDIYEGLKVYGKKYGTDYELATLGVISSLPAALDQLISDLSDVSDFLQSSKGYGFFGLGRKQGLMHAAMIVGGHYINRNVNTTMQSVAVSGTISLIAAQQAAIIASVAAASAAASAASSSV